MKLSTKNLPLEDSINDPKELKNIISDLKKRVFFP